MHSGKMSIDPNVSFAWVWISGGSCDLMTVKACTGTNKDLLLHSQLKRRCVLIRAMKILSLFSFLAKFESLEAFIKNEVTRYSFCLTFNFFSFEANLLSPYCFATKKINFLFKFRPKQNVLTFSKWFSVLVLVETMKGIKWELANSPSSTHISIFKTKLFNSLFPIWNVNNLSWLELTFMNNLC